MSRSIPSTAFTPVLVLAIIIIICSGIPAVSAADASYVGELGDTIALQGVSYTGTRVFLFMTGPGLPENGVTLTDVTQRADQGQFTIVDLDSNQQWAMKWNTQRIHTEIVPGTYTVYVVNEPVDKAHLGSSSSYQTLSVYLKKDTSISQGSSSGGTTYTLNPEEHSSTVIATSVPVNTTTIPAPSRTSSPANASPTPVPTTTTRASAHPLTALIAVIGITGFLLCRKLHS